mmetsp:Transcript_19042/g.73299  ORF Transcript_19042/g.73299 Transcript_19042/m.73299 type:complete len:218 (+) Transcript_19042:1338-1991(+)
MPVSPLSTSTEKMPDTSHTSTSTSWISMSTLVNLSSMPEGGFAAMSNWRAAAASGFTLKKAFVSLSLKIVIVCSTNLYTGHFSPARLKSSRYGAAVMSNSWVFLVKLRLSILLNMRLILFPPRERQSWSRASSCSLSHSGPRKISISFSASWGFVPKLPESALQTIFTASSTTRAPELWEPAQSTRMSLAGMSILTGLRLFMLLPWPSLPLLPSPKA